MRSSSSASFRRVLIVTFGLTVPTSLSLWLDLFLLGEFRGAWSAADLWALTRGVGLFGTVLAVILLFLGLTPVQRTSSPRLASRTNVLTH